MTRYHISFTLALHLLFKANSLIYSICFKDTTRISGEIIRNNFYVKKQERNSFLPRYSITKTKIDFLKFFKILREFFSIIVLHTDINVATTLMLLSAIFHFSSNDTPWKKPFFCPQDIRIFVFPSSPLFSSVSHCSIKWFKLNLQVYDVINWLNKNLRKHLVWYLEKQKLGQSIEY